ncbi:dihydrolipoyl dehydrogenase [Halobacteriales archaeon QH_10_67_22]|nr:MAG: dihydrolipoyl dehydrogenase [Halobacteriales archaeon QH_10_67_22]
MVVGDVTTGTDVLVIGGGPGGYVAAIRAGQLGMDVTLVEADAYGGTCLNHGCIPSKALVSAADVAHDARTAEHMGVHADPAVDVAGMVDWKDGVVDQLTGGVEKLCKAAGVELVSGRAEFAGEHTARVVYGGDGQGSETVEFEHAIIATGSRPVEVPGFAFEDEPTREALALETLPESLVVVGAGYIGMELSTVFQKLGCDVTVVEMLADALPGYEDDITRVVRERAADLGVDFHFGESATGWERASEGITVLTEDEGGDVSEFGAEYCLVAVGRSPVTDTFNLAAVDLEPDEESFLATDDQARTDVDHVFAVGDVAGEPMLAHKASAEGEVAAEVIAGEPAGLDYQAVPAAVFTSGRALTVDDTDGFVRVVAATDGEFLLGGQVVGPEASELVAELGLAVEMGAQLGDVAATVHTHPTLSEAVREACANALGEAVHTLNR